MKSNESASKAQAADDDITALLNLANSFETAMSNQFKSFRRNGRFENCMTYMNDWWLCTTSSVFTDPNKRQARYQQMKILEEKKIVNDAWEYKVKPSWISEE